METRFEDNAAGGRIRKIDIIPGLDSLESPQGAKHAKKRFFPFPPLFSFAGVSAAKEKAVDFAVFARLAKRAVKYYREYVIELKIQRPWSGLWMERGKESNHMRTGGKRVSKGVERGEPFEIEVDGEKIVAYEGETVGAALLAAGQRTLRYTNKLERPRGLYCGIGLCQECRITINGVPNAQACQTLVTPGCRVETVKSLKRRES